MTDKNKVNDELKTCNICKSKLPLEEYYSTMKNKGKISERLYFLPYCKECTRSKTKNWRDNNKEKVKDIKKRDNKKRVKIKRADEQRRRDAGLYKEWQNNNKDKMKEYGRKRAIKNHDITDNEWASCKEYFNNSCAYCGLTAENHYKKYKGVDKLIDLHKEHVDDNGANDISNCIPSCHHCNSRKWSFDFYEWYSEGSENYSIERFERIIKWLNSDYKTQ